MMIEFWTDCICPYCEHENSIIFTKRGLHDKRVKTMSCDQEEGGCGRMFAAAVSLEARTTIYRMERVREE